MIVDLDVHQGDATALIFADDPRVFTFSAHAASNFPSRKQSSDCDLPFEDGVEDQAYGAAIGEALPSLLDRFKPELVLYNAGVDPHRDDRLGRLCLSDLGLLQRDHLVFDACLRRQIPVASVIGGGYDALDSPGEASCPGVQGSDRPSEIAWSLRGQRLSLPPRCSASVLSHLARVH